MKKDNLTILRKRMGDLLLPPKNYGIKKTKKKYYYVEFESGKRKRFESNIERSQYIKEFLNFHPNYEVSILISTNADVKCLSPKIEYDDIDFETELWLDE